MIKTFAKLILIVIGIVLVFIIGYIVLFIWALGGFNKDYSVTELKENFEDKKIEIYELKKYFNGIVTQNKFVEIEFENDNTLGRFGIRELDSTKIKPRFLEWDLKINSKRTDSIIGSLGWTRETLKTLKDKLDNANCIGIESGEPSKISFQRSGMGMYFFNVFDSPIPENQKEKYNDGCTYVLANDKLVLEYGGGAIGSQCFYNKK